MRDDRKNSKFSRKPGGKSGPRRESGKGYKGKSEDRGGERKWVDKRGDKPRGDKPRKDKPWEDRKDRKFEGRKFEGKKSGDFKKDSFKRAPFRDEKPREREPREAKERGPRPNLYGFHACREAWLNPERRVSALYITHTAEDEFAETLEAGKALRRPLPTSIDKEVLDRMLPRSAVHQGIAMIAENPGDVFIQDFIIKSQQQEKTILLMLDQVTDPHNVGAILRSASAFGATGVIMQRKHAPELEGALAKSASGAVEHMPVAYETNLSRALEELKESGFFVFGLDERGSREVGDILRNNNKGDQKIVLVLGAEGDGMRRLVRENCDELVRLPTSGPIQSLNVSNAAAVALYALCSAS